MRIWYGGIALLIVATAGCATQSTQAESVGMVAAEPPGSTPQKATSTIAAPATIAQPTPAAPIPSTSTPTPEEDVAKATAIVETVGPELALDDQELACLTERLARRPELIAQQDEAATVDSEPFLEVATIGQACADSIRFGPLFAQSIQDESAGRLSDEQMKCVQGEYANLTSDDRSTLTSGALVQDDGRVKEHSTAIRARVRTACGI